MTHPVLGVIELAIFLDDPSLLFARQRTRTYWFAVLIAVSASAALVGLVSAWRAFHRQELLARMQGQFVSSVSHELRAPIASIRLLAEGLELGRVRAADNQAEYFSLMGQECRRLTALIENVLDFSRIDQGRKQFEFEPTDVCALVRQTVRLMEGINASPQSSSPPAPSENPGPAVDPALSAIGMRLKEIQNKANSRPAAGVIPWENWNPEVVDQARAAGHPVLVSFAADWCVSCQLNRETSIEIKSVADKLKKLDAAVFLGDHTEKDPVITAELQPHGRSSVPLVLIYPKNTETPPRMLPETLTPAIVLEALDWAAH